jgi:hypothetical protein
MRSPARFASAVTAVLIVNRELGDAMSNNLGVFGWIRENVRRSVLLGFSDAVEQIGGAVEGEDLHPQLAAVLRDAAPRAIGLGSESAMLPKPQQPKKRLGRSLEQLRTPPRPAEQ